MVGPGGEVHLEPKVMQVLEYLARTPGQVVERDTLLNGIWEGRAFSDEPLSRCVFELRRALGDSAKDPRYIETIPKSGYRLIATVEPLTDVAVEASDMPGEEPGLHRRSASASQRRIAVTGLLGLIVIAAIYAVYQSTPTNPSDSPQVTAEGVLSSAPPVYSVAVLPFENLSALDEDGYFVDGLHDEVLTQLAKLPSFDKVIAQTTMEQYRDTSKPVSTIGQELDVAAVLEGGVQRAGNRIRINVQLIAAATDEILWAEAFERALTAENIFEIQEQIAREVSGALRITLTPDEDDKLAKLPTKNLEAYSAYLESKAGIATDTSASLLEAIAQLQRAIELDPDFAVAHAGLAKAYWAYGNSTVNVTTRKLPDGVTLKYVEQLIERALALDPDLGFAHAIRGKLLAWKEDPTAGAEFERALELSPGDAEIYLDYALYLYDTEPDIHRSAEMIELGLRLDPKSSLLNTHAGWSSFELHRPDEAMTYFKHAVELDPDSAHGYAGIGVMHWHYGGRIDEAVRWLGIAYSKDPTDVSHICWVGWSYLFLDDDDEAERWFRHALALGPENFLPARGLVDVYGWRGEYDRQREIFDELQVDDPGREWSLLIRDAHYEQALEVAESEYEKHLQRFRDKSQDLADLSDWARSKLAWQEARMALTLDRLEEKERAMRLLGRVEQYVNSRMSLQPYEYRMMAFLQALLGRADEAVESLRRSYQYGSLYMWRFQYANPAFGNVRDEPEYRSLIQDVTADMAMQLERVREMERNGEIPMLP